MASQNIDIIISAKDLASKSLKGIEKNLWGIREAIDRNQETFQKMAWYWAVAFTAITYGANKAIDSAVNLWESINAVNVVFWDASDKIKQFWEISAKSVGLSNSAFNQLSTETGTLLKATGMNLDKVADSTIDLTNRASDLASVFNTDVEIAMSAINQALRWETEAIRKFGSDVTDASIDQYLLAQGINKTSTELTQQEKTFYRMQKIMADTSQVTGDFANTSDSLANRQRVLSAETENTRASIWELLIPMKQMLYDTLFPLVEKISDFTKQHPELTKNIIITTAAIAGIVTVLWTLWLVIPTIITWVTGLWTALMFLAANPIWMVITAIGAGIAIGVLIVKNWDTIKEKAIELWTYLMWLYEKYKILFAIFLPMISIGIELYKNWDTIKGKAIELWKTIYWIWKEIREWFSNLVTSAKDWWGNMIQMFVDGVKEKVQVLKDWILQIATTISDYLWFHSPAKKWPASDSDRWMPNMITMLTNGIYKGITPIQTASANLASAISENLWKSISLESIWGLLESLKWRFQSTFSDIESQIQNSASKISSIKDEIASLTEQLESVAESRKSLKEDTKWQLANRVLELEAKLQEENLDYFEKKKIKEELALATEEAGIRAINEAREWANMTETERILATSKQKDDELKLEATRINILLEEKKSALEQEQIAYQKLNDSRVEFEKSYQKLFLENISTRILKMKEAISLMNRLNWVWENVSNAVSWARANGGTVQAGRSYLVGEQGRELFVPQTSGTIVPNASLGGGITINMWGVSVSNEADENRLVEKIKKAFIQEAKLYNLWIS